MMSSQTVAAQIVRMLENAGVTRIHGIVGDSLNAITDEVRQSKKITWIHYRHEEAAAFAAGAEAQLTGKLAVCAGSCGPGNMHLINGLYDAHRSCAPVLAIAAHIPSEQIGTTYFQETRPESLFRECSHYCETISHPSQMPTILNIAMQTAMADKGVSVISISGDIALQVVNHQGTLPRAHFPKAVIHPHEEELSEVASMLNKAHKVTLFCGAGVAEAHDEVVALSQKLNAPIIHALGGKEYISYDNPHDIGMTGLIGYAAANNALHQSDLILILGSNFPYKEWYPENVPKIQIDLRAAMLSKRCAVDIGLQGDIKPTLSLLLPKIQQKTDNTFLKNSLREYAENQKTIQSLAVPNDSVIHPEYLAKIISEKADKDAIFTADVGTPVVWFARYVQMTKERRFLSSLRHGSMANAMPQAIGAQLTYPNRQVIALCGDGGFGMLMGELLTIYQYNLPVKIFIHNNGILGFVAMEMKVGGLIPFGTDLKNPNFAAMANAIGIKGIRVEKSSEIVKSVEDALAHKGPVLVDVLVNPNELSMPPKVTLAQAKGFSVYAVKEAFYGNVSEVWNTVKTNFLEK